MVPWGNKSLKFESPSYGCLLHILQHSKWILQDATISPIKIYTYHKHQSTHFQREFHSVNVTIHPHSKRCVTDI